MLPCKALGSSQGKAANLCVLFQKRVLVFSNQFCHSMQCAGCGDGSLQGSCSALEDFPAGQPSRSAPVCICHSTLIMGMSSSIVISACLLCVLMRKQNPTSCSLWWHPLATVASCLLADIVFNDHLVSKTLLVSFRLS